MIHTRQYLLAKKQKGEMETHPVIVEITISEWSI